LRTPITAMRINLEFIEDTELRDRLLKNLDELQDLTEAVLSAARGTGGESARQIDLSSLVESICADLDDLGEPVVWNGHTPAPLYCRANEVRRAIRNLIENAVAYGKKAEVSIQEVQGTYEVVVDDVGPGIPPEDRSRVFEPFVRLEGSRNEETGGTGLGLTQVKTIAEGHGGKVVLEDRPGGGLRVRFSLPRQPVPRTTKVAI
jgi:signal transduction histidine kinase